jgi:hypothetical protein
VQYQIPQQGIAMSQLPEPMARQGNLMWRNTDLKSLAFISDNTVSTWRNDGLPSALQYR